MSDEHDWAFGDGGFAKLYGDRLVQSSLMDETVSTRWVFLFMCARADAAGRFYSATFEGLARAANVTPGQARKAVERLEAPDPASTTPDNEGRRIKRIPGGWLVLNLEKFRNYQTKRQREEADRKRRQREEAEKRRREQEAELARREAEVARLEGAMGHVPGHPADVTGTSAPDVRRQTSNVTTNHGEPQVQVAPDDGHPRRPAPTERNTSGAKGRGQLSNRPEVLEVIQARAELLGGVAEATAPKVKAAVRALEAGFSVQRIRDSFEAIRAAREGSADGRSMAAFCATRNTKFEYSLRPETLQAILDEVDAAAPAAKPTLVKPERTGFYSIGPRRETA